MRRILKRMIPSPIRLPLRILWIRFSDLVQGKRFKFAKFSSSKGRKDELWSPGITISQRINASEWAENKKHNLLLAISNFQNIPILPGEIFSFWHFVGKPTEKEGYKVGINIINSRLDFDYGGGLCQLSGLLYHLALTAGLKMEERHPHSVDLYSDETRYTPLGADATTAYGYKDLRFQNSLSFPFCFHIEIVGNQLIGSICAPGPLKEHEIIFQKRVVKNREEVDTLVRNDSGGLDLICSQSYLISDHDQVI